MRCSLEINTGVRVKVKDCKGGQLVSCAVLVSRLQLHELCSQSHVCSVLVVGWGECFSQMVQLSVSLLRWDLGTCAGAYRMLSSGKASKSK